MGRVTIVVRVSSSCPFTALSSFSSACFSSVFSSLGMQSPHSLFVLACAIFAFSSTSRGFRPHPVRSPPPRLGSSVSFLSQSLTQSLSLSLLVQPAPASPPQTASAAPAMPTTTPATASATPKDGAPPTTPSNPQSPTVTKGLAPKEPPGVSPLTYGPLHPINN